MSEKLADNVECWSSMEFDCDITTHLTSPIPLMQSSRDGFT